MAAKPSVDEQMQVLMRGVEYGDAHIHKTMEQELRERLSQGRPLRVYCGFDPTSTDLTIGNLVPMLKMRQFQRLGHEVTFLFGTMTGIVGDPSDKTAARQMLTLEQVEANAREWLRQVYRVLDQDRTVIRRNSDWLADLTLTDVIELGSHFTVAQFLERETFAKRMEEHKPIYVHEFLYALMQARDAVELETDVQIGGVDQLFNIMAGRILQRDLGQRPLVVICTPLLVGTDGHLKMSKSAGNYIGMDDAPADMYGKVMSIPDSLVLDYYTLLTEVPGEELGRVGEDLQGGGTRAMEAKKRLGREIVGLLYGEEAAGQAQEEFERVFQRRERPEESALDLPLDFDEDGVIEVDVTQLLSQSGAVGSRAEAKRLLSQGAISLDGSTLSEPRARLREGALLRVGRHRFLRIVRQA
ncbi:MAG TPA: tyrosine--tRNA ligase [Dehalococcoidia bacterium]|jgi:tyrosyl-tRNA synthetase|nr:tyrosine--tRNA ligase [Dehalococcoidia bacterium]